MPKREAEAPVAKTEDKRKKGSSTKETNEFEEATKEVKKPQKKDSKIMQLTKKLFTKAGVMDDIADMTEKKVKSQGELIEMVFTRFNNNIHSMKEVVWTLTCSDVTEFPDIVAVPTSGENTPEDEWLLAVHSYPEK